MIRLTCPKCSKKLAVDDTAAGTVCKCPACGSKFRVPKAAAAPPAAVGRARPGGAKPAAGQDSGAADGLELVEDEAPPPPRKPAAPARDSGRGRKPAPPPGAVTDELETVEDEADATRPAPARRPGRAPGESGSDDPGDDRPRRKPKKPRSGATPQWVTVTAAAAGVLLCALAPVAYFFKFVAIILAVIGLPASLLSRKWYALGGVGVAYLLTGAGFFVLHNSRPVTAPPANATPDEVDAWCAGLLKDWRKQPADKYLGLEKPTDTPYVRSIRRLIAEALDAGAEKVWLTHLDRTDEAGLFFPHLIVVLPDDEQRRESVYAWYRLNSPTRAPGNKYLYVEY